MPGRGGARRSPRSRRSRSSGGYTLLELMFVTALAAIVAAAAIPQTLAGVERSRTLGAARYLASRLALSRAQAAARSANVALLLAGGGASLTVAAYRDGNGNGVRTRDIAAGNDPVIEAPVRFADRFPRVSLLVNDPNAIQPNVSAIVSFFQTWYVSYLRR
jgi:prepilin-type N-terminal cleavage/methylation domain-containing protein